jgi:hypothetical protein
VLCFGVIQEGRRREGAVRRSLDDKVNKEHDIWVVVWAGPQLHTQAHRMLCLRAGGRAVPFSDPQGTTQPQCICTVPPLDLNSIAALVEALDGKAERHSLESSLPSFGQLLLQGG